MSAIAGQQHQPVFARKFGRSFQRLDSTASLCYHDLGKVKVDCRFRHSKSQWGVLDKEEFPAGILYMDLCFDQPQGYKLSKAIIRVTLLDELPQDEARQAPVLRSSLQMTDQYGPRQITGEAKTIAVKKTYRGTPHINVLGNGGGRVGVDEEKSHFYISRWTFTGQLQPGEPARHAIGAIYKTIKWELNENELDSRVMHSNIIHTGFTFTHGREICFLKVEISGELQRTRHRVMNHLRFPPGSKKDQGSTVTKVDLRQTEQFRKRLDPIADGLARALEMENYTEIPVEIRDTLPVSFQPASHSTNSKVPVINSQPTISSVPEIGSTPAISATPAEPTLESLTQGLFYYTSPIEQVSQRGGSLDSRWLDQDYQRDSTEVEQVSQVKETQEQVGQGLREVAAAGKAVAQQEVLLRLSQSPAFLILIQFLANFLDLFDKMSALAKKGRGKDNGDNGDRDRDRLTTTAGEGHMK
ncbi:hypothetical protein B7463_g892, partial [Scytalidium lignicola]